jgi:heme A synthase
VALVLTYCLVVLGAVVRITESGMGCGDDWPLCNGQLIPTGDLATFLEWGHRLMAVLVSLLIAALAAVSWKPGRDPSWGPRRRLTAWAVVLLVIQILLGAVTVWLELPPASVILHLGTAMALLAVLVVIALRAHRSTERAARVADGATRTGWLVATGAYLVVLAGALVANLDATAACRGFPLCGGQWWPAQSGPAQVQWAHRLLAYAFTVAVLFVPGMVGSRRPGDGAARGTAFALVALVFSQIVVGAALVTGPLDLSVRALHMALGTAIFGVAVALAWMIRRPTGYGRTSRTVPGPCGGTEGGAAEVVEA